MAFAMKDLEEAAARLASTSEPSHQNVFRGRLANAADVEMLRDLAQRYTPHSEVSIPVYQRLLELSPRDVGAIAALGFVFFLDGEDEQAWRQVSAGRAIEPENVELLTLEAALVKDRPARIALYRKVLEKDPGNRVATENLKELGEL